MKTNQTLETDNLVLFPSSKHYAQELDLRDPLMDLINEYAHIADSEIPSYLNECFEDEHGVDDEQESEENAIFGSLEAFMTRNQGQESLSPDDKLARAINERIDAINEARQKIKFYLDEIEMFLPRRRN